MLRTLTIIVIFCTAAMTAVVLYAATSGHAHASKVVYKSGEDTSTLTLEDGVTFDYSGYHFSSGSANITVDRPEADAVEADLREASFAGGVDVTTPSGGRMHASDLKVTRDGDRYAFSGGIKYSEGPLQIQASAFSFDERGSTFNAQRDVIVKYDSPRGLMGKDGKTHPLTYKGSGVTYDGMARKLKNTGDAITTVQFDGLDISAKSFDVGFSAEGVMDIAAAGGIEVSGEGISLSGLNAEYSAATGEFRLWGDVKYSRGGDEFTADEVTWFVAEGGKRIKAKGGSGVVGIGNNGG